MEFDAVAYAATENLFETALRAYRELPGLLDEYHAQYALHGGLSDAVGNATLTDGQDALIDHLEKHDAILKDIVRTIDEYNTALEAAHNVLNLLKDPMDAQLLRLRYLCGMPEHKIVKMEVNGQKVWQYSDRYIYERKAIALVHASAVVRELELVKQYS